MVALQVVPVVQEAAVLVVKAHVLEVVPLVVQEDAPPDVQEDAPPDVLAVAIPVVAIPVKTLPPENAVHVHNTAGNHVPQPVRTHAVVPAMPHVRGDVWEEAAIIAQAAVCIVTDLAVPSAIITAVQLAPAHHHSIMEYKADSIGIKEVDRGWQGGMAKNITFIVTKDCQLACKYCYLVGKNVKERMSWEVAKAFIDYVLDHENDPDFATESVVWDFIGGEPFLEIELIDKICDYIKTQLFCRNHHWFNSYRFSFSTNGINYHEKAVQDFIKKNREHLSIGVTIDGTEKKHNLNRVWKQPQTGADGLVRSSERGSYQDVVKNIPLWLKQFPLAGTKVTISSADIPYIKESVMHIYSLGVREVNINVVFEDVWQEGDDLKFEDQLMQLADAIIDGDYYQDYACSFFSEHIGKPLDPKLDNQNWCGAGKMLSVDAAGNLYPCTRFAQYSLRDKGAWIIGNIRDGIDKNKLRPFLTLDRSTQSPVECLECEVASGCAWCQGENYDAARTHTVFQRSTANCLMHKARVRANNYYWNKLYRKLELANLREQYEANKCEITPKIC